MNIYIGKTIVLSDMQGPCPDGFHVPLQSEWQAIVDAFTGLGLSGGINFSTYLKMPMAGDRNSLATVYSVGSYGYYDSSSYYNGNSSYRYCLRFDSSNIEPTVYTGRSLGFSIRGIKNSSIIPTAFWTKLYGTSIESGGIFWNSADGLISISSNGTTWYTLMDKNIGANTVYNYGDTLTDANCGNVFQWGNNYAFPGTLSSDSITTSSTQVDVTGYGPGNYYESSTWVTAQPRQSSANDGNNLRGGVSQGTSTKSVEVKNIYIGEVTGWKPGGNTLAYFPLDNDTSDHSGNGKTLTNTGTKTTIGYNFTDTSMVSGGLPDVAFFSAWVKNNSASGNYSCMTPSFEKYCCGYFNYNSVYGNKFFCVIGSRTRLDGPTNPSQWHNICIGYDGAKMVYGIDGVMQTLVNGKGDYVNNDTYLFRKDSGVSASINISEAIFESVCWTAEEYAEYFTQTKSNYGL